MDEWMEVKVDSGWDSRWMEQRDRQKHRGVSIHHSTLETVQLTRNCKPSLILIPQFMYKVLIHGFLYLRETSFCTPYHVQNAYNRHIHETIILKNISKINARKERTLYSTLMKHRCRSKTDSCMVPATLFSLAFPPLYLQVASCIPVPLWCHTWFWCRPLPVIYPSSFCLPFPPPSYLLC